MALTWTGETPNSPAEAPSQASMGLSLVADPAAKGAGDGERGWFLTLLGSVLAEDGE